MDTKSGTGNNSNYYGSNNSNYYGKCSHSGTVDIREYVVHLTVQSTCYRHILHIAVIKFPLFSLHFQLVMRIVFLICTTLQLLKCMLNLYTNLQFTIPPFNRFCHSSRSLLSMVITCFNNILVAGKGKIYAYYCDRLATVVFLKTILLLPKG